MTDTVAGNNGNGIVVSGAAAGAKLDDEQQLGRHRRRPGQVDQTTVTANGIGLAAANGAQLQSCGTNSVSGNADGVPTITVALE
jgi:hypothetical protein